MMAFNSPRLTPPASDAGSLSCDENTYFSRPYVPLSNLPTPPPSLSSSTTSRTSGIDFSSVRRPELLGPAMHLANLIPSSVSLLDADVNFVHSLLIRASLPEELLGLACCILDSLNSRFAMSWRRRCPVQKSFNLNSTVPHIDIVRPEIIILSSLIIAVKFQDDHETSTSSYAAHWGLGQWTVSQLNITEQCILENLGYRIMPLWREGLINDALLDMEYAGMSAMCGPSWIEDYEKFQLHEAEPQQHIMNDGKAVWSSMRQITPAVTPTGENMSPTNELLSETRRAFGSVNPGLSYQGLNLDMPVRMMGVCNNTAAPATESGRFDY